MKLGKVSPPPVKPLRVEKVAAPAIQPRKPTFENRGFKGRWNKSPINPKKDWNDKGRY